MPAFIITNSVDVVDVGWAAVDARRSALPILVPQPLGRNVMKPQNLHLSTSFVFAHFFSDPTAVDLVDRLSFQEKNKGTGCMTAKDDCSPFSLT